MQPIPPTPNVLGTGQQDDDDYLNKLHYLLLLLNEAVITEKKNKLRVPNLRLN